MAALIIKTMNYTITHQLSLDWDVADASSFLTREVDFNGNKLCSLSVSLGIAGLGVCGFRVLNTKLGLEV